MDIDGNDKERERQATHHGPDVMTRGVLSVGPTPPAEIATVLSTGAVRAVPVSTIDRRLLGVVSEADLLVTVEREVPVNGLRRWRPRHTRKPGPVAKVGARTAWS